MSAFRLKDCYDPTGSKPHKKQAEFLMLDRRGAETSHNHLVGGRGSAKTTSLALLAIQAAFVWMPGLPGCWTEPTYGLCRDIFLAEWQRLVPLELYTINASRMVIECRNGSLIYVRSRNVDNKYKEVIKGINLAWVIEDEIAYKYDKQKFWDVDAAIRIDTPYRFHDTGTTPKMNEYYNLMHDENGDLKKGHRIVQASSHDNPHLPKGWADNLAENFDERYAEQEIFGRWISLSGRIWDRWSDEIWPNGNVHPHKHDHDKPYYLLLDIGVAGSAWVIVQELPVQFEMINRGYKRDDTIWVATAEFMPSTERGGHITRVLPLIKEQFGTPIRICCGHDVGNRSLTRGETPRSILSNHFGSIPTTPIGASGNYRSDKILQHAQLSGGIYDTRGRRRFCVSQDYYKHNPETNRGLVQLMKQDTWPSSSDGKIHPNYLPKEGRLEHVRDALLYGSVGVMFKPSYGLKEAYAA